MAGLPGIPFQQDVDLDDDKNLLVVGWIDVSEGMADMTMADGSELRTPMIFVQLEHAVGEEAQRVQLMIPSPLVVPLMQAIGQALGTQVERITNEQRGRN